MLGLVCNKPIMEAQGTLDQIDSNPKNLEITEIKQ